MSQRYWGLSWPSLLPWRFEGEIDCECSTIEEIRPFMQESYSTIFEGTADRWLRDPVSPAKIRFYQESDVFVLRQSGRIVGVLLANPSDWNTYYLRSVAFLPQCQNRGIVSDWIERAAEVLKEHGVLRFETEIAPGNVRAMHLLNRLGFVATGTLLTARWGALVRMTRYLNSEAGEFFAERFCMGSALLEARRDTSR